MFIWSTVASFLEGFANGRVLCLHLCPYLPGTSLCHLQGFQQGPRALETLGSWGSGTSLNFEICSVGPCRIMALLQSQGTGFQDSLHFAWKLCPWKSGGQPLGYKHSDNAGSPQENGDLLPGLVSWAFTKGPWSEEPMFGLTIYCHHFEIFNKFWRKQPTFSFYAGSCKLCSPKASFYPNKLPSAAFARGAIMKKTWQ